MEGLEGQEHSKSQGSTLLDDQASKLFTSDYQDLDHALTEALKSFPKDNTTQRNQVLQSLSSQESLTRSFYISLSDYYNKERIEEGQIDQLLSQNNLGSYTKESLKLLNRAIAIDQTLLTPQEKQRRIDKIKKTNPKLTNVFGQNDLKIENTPLTPETLTAITDLVWIESLRLNRTQITKLPKSMGNLTKLQLLELMNNQLTALPAEIRNLTNLEILKIYGNNLESVPAEIRNLTKLTELDLSANPLVAQGKEGQTLGWKELREIFGARFVGGPQTR